MKCEMKLSAMVLAAAGLFGLLGSSTAFAAATVYASYDGSYQGVTVRDLALNQQSYFGTGFNINGIAAGPNNTVFLASGNHLYDYNANGTLITDMTFPDTGINYTDVSVSAPVPEPSDVALIAVGLGLIGLRRRVREKVTAISNGR